VFNFKQTQMKKTVYFSRINQSPCRTLIGAVVGKNKTSTYIRTNFIGFLEIIAFQGLSMNILTVQNIRTFMYKYDFVDQNANPPAAYEQRM
jgi:hypothetical protein